LSQNAVGFPSRVVSAISLIFSASGDFAPHLIAKLKIKVNKVNISKMKLS
jgi:hypothetical protein